MKYMVLYGTMSQTVLSNLFFYLSGMTTWPLVRRHSKASGHRVYSNSDSLSVPHLMVALSLMGQTPSGYFEALEMTVSKQGTTNEGRVRHLRASPATWQDL